MAAAGLPLDTMLGEETGEREPGARPGLGEEDPQASGRGGGVRRSLPVLIDPEDLENLLIEDGRDCLSAGNSPRPSDGPTVGEEGQELMGGGQRRPASLARHESLPSLHLNARCLKCDRVGTVYCKGCEAHFCHKHDRKQHRFTIRKDRHEHKPLRGISYFRLPLPNDPNSQSQERESFMSPSSEGFEDEDVSDMSTTSPPPLAATGASSTSAARKAARGARASSSAEIVRPEDMYVEVEQEGEAGARAARAGRGGAGAGAGAGAGVNRQIVGSGRGGRGLDSHGAGAGVRRRSSNSSSTRRKPPKLSKSAIDLARSGWYNKMVMAIVRPLRCKYTEEDLGPMLTPLSSGVGMKRRDFEVRNRRGLKLVCSQWRPAYVDDTSLLPCVVFLHGNCSARIDVINTRSLTLLGKAACTVVSFDFSGSGMSEGDWVTLGYFEQHDVADVLAYLRSNDMASRYLLWGRSMGAVSALLYAACYPNSDLCGLILDSPFSSFGQLAKDLVTQGQTNVPGFFVNWVLGMLRRSVKKRTRCDLKTLAPIEGAAHIRCPCLFIAARKDVMVRPKHGADLSQAVGGANLFITCKGSHNTPRPGVVLTAISTFVKGCFQAPVVPIARAFATIEAKLEEARSSTGSIINNNSSSGNARGGGGGGEGGLKTGRRTSACSSNKITPAGGVRPSISGPHRGAGARSLRMSEGGHGVESGRGGGGGVVGTASRHQRQQNGGSQNHRLKRPFAGPGPRAMEEEWEPGSEAESHESEQEEVKSFAGVQKNQLARPLSFISSRDAMGLSFDAAISSSGTEGRERSDAATDSKELFRRRRSKSHNSSQPPYSGYQQQQKLQQRQPLLLGSVPLDTGESKAEEEGEGMAMPEPGDNFEGLGFAAKAWGGSGGGGTKVGRNVDRSTKPFGRGIRPVDRRPIVLDGPKRGKNSSDGENALTGMFDIYDDGEKKSLTYNDRRPSLENDLGGSTGELSPSPSSWRRPDRRPMFQQGPGEEGEGGGAAATAAAAAVDDGHSKREEGSGTTGREGGGGMGNREKRRGSEKKKGKGRGGLSSLFPSLEEPLRSGSIGSWTSADAAGTSKGTARAAALASAPVSSEFADYSVTDAAADTDRDAFREVSRPSVIHEDCQATDAPYRRAPATKNNGDGSDEEGARGKRESPVEKMGLLGGAGAGGGAGGADGGGGGGGGGRGWFGRIRIKSPALQGFGRTGRGRKWGGGGMRGTPAAGFSHAMMTSRSRGGSGPRSGFGLSSFSLRAGRGGGGSGVRFSGCRTCNEAPSDCSCTLQSSERRASVLKHPNEIRTASGKLKM